MLKFDNGIDKIVMIYSDDTLDNTTISYISTILSKLDPNEAPIDAILEVLKSQNAFLRNSAISLLQGYGKAIKYYIVKYLIGDDRDLRIFAINVLGDVKFPESRDMLVELLQKEQDINVAMTAVDYLAEIGEIVDIPLLDSLKDKFSNEPYVVFAVNNAIRMIKG
jgi:HEAT repeat protein